MYIKNKEAFTFVELIVVITILVILSVIGLGAYQSYLGDSRDTNRLLQMSEMYEGMYTYSISSKLPYPEEMIEIQASGNTFANQGYAGENTIKIVGYDGGGKDIEYDTYLTYMLSNNGRDFQLMTYTDDRELLGSSLTSQSHAVQDFTSMFPKVLGPPLGILIDKESNAPIQSIDTYVIPGFYDIVSGTESIISYLSDNKRLSFSEGDDLSFIIPNKSCKRILDLGKSMGNGEYIITHDGVIKTQVYCDMEIDGGGWTYAGFIHEAASSDSVFFDRAFGGYDVKRTSSGSSYMLSISEFSDTEALLLYNTNDINEAEETDNLIILRYSDKFPGMNSGPLTSVSTKTDFFGAFNGIEYRTNFNKEWEFTRENIGWGIESNDQSQAIFQIRTSSRGIEKFTGLWGANPDVRIRDNSAYIYIR